MNRVSLANVTLLVPLLSVTAPVPCPEARPTDPLKLPTVETSLPGAGKKMWNSSVPGPNSSVPPRIGLGDGLQNRPGAVPSASATVGKARFGAIASPAAPTAPAMKFRREKARDQKCGCAPA